MSLEVKYPIIVRQYADVIDSPPLLRKSNTTYSPYSQQASLIPLTVPIVNKQADPGGVNEAFGSGKIRVRCIDHHLGNVVV